MTGTVKEGRYFLNNKEILEDGEGFLDNCELFRFKGIYSNEYVLFNGYEGVRHLKHGVQYKPSDSLVYCMNNILVKKVFLPKSIFGSYEILFIGK